MLGLAPALGRKGAMAVCCCLVVMDYGDAVSEYGFLLDCFLGLIDWLIV